MGVTAETEVFDIEGLAYFIGMSKRTIYRLVTAGRLPAAKIGHKWIFEQRALRSWLKKEMLKNCSKAHN